MTLREQIIEEARKYLGAPFLHQGRTCDGMDCVGLLVLAFGKFLDVPDFHGYVEQPTSAQVYRRIRGYADRIAGTEAGPGDVVLMRFGDYSTHFGIITDTGIIHAHAMPKKVIENRHDNMPDGGRIAAYWRMKGIPAWQQ